MPLYPYRCESCGVQFDQQQRFTDPQMVICPECGEPALRKLFQPVGIVFRGSGFYATDHRSPSGQTSWKKDEKAEKGEKSDKSEKSEKSGKSETGGAPAAKEGGSSENA